MAAKKAARPSFTPPARVRGAVVKKLPPARRPSTQVYPHRYQETLAAIRKDVGPGKHVVVATYTSPHGARNAKGNLVRGEYRCDGPPSDWEFEARRTDEDEGGGSTLYATLKAKTPAKKITAKK